MGPIFSKYFGFLHHFPFHQERNFHIYHLGLVKWATHAHIPRDSALLNTINKKNTKYTQITTTYHSILDLVGLEVHQHRWFFHAFIFFYAFIFFCRAKHSQICKHTYVRTLQWRFRLKNSRYAYRPERNESVSEELVNLVFMFLFLCVHMTGLPHHVYASLITSSL
jgi:hypothetical protein